MILPFHLECFPVSVGLKWPTHFCFTLWCIGWCFFHHIIWSKECFEKQNDLFFYLNQCILSSLSFVPLPNDWVPVDLLAGLRIWQPLDMHKCLTLDSCVIAFESSMQHWLLPCQFWSLTSSMNVRILITLYFVLDLSSYWQWIRISGWSVLDMHDCLTIEPLIIALRQCLCIQLLNHAATFVMHAWILVTERSAKPNEPEQSWIKVEITTPRLVVSHVFDYRLMDRQSHLQDSRTKPKLSKAVHQVSACHRRWSWEHASH